MSFVQPTSLYKSSTFRLALLYMGLFGASVLLLLGFIYWATAGYMSRQTDATIEAEITGLAEQYRQRGLTGLSNVIAQRIARNPGGASVYVLADPDYRPLVGNLDRWPEATPGGDGWLTFSRTLTAIEAGETHGPYPVRARAFRLAGNLNLLVGRDIRDLRNIRGMIAEALAWGLALTAALGLIGGAMMSRSMMRRIDSINQAAAEIMTGDLTRRIPGKGTGDDFDRLIDNLNAMLDRIEGLMDSVRQVSDNIAHDLRTPLTRLRGELEQLRASMDEQESEAVERAIAEADGLLATFSALLRIARIEAAGTGTKREPVALGTVLCDVVDFYEPLAQEKGQALTLSVPADGQGEEEARDGAREEARDEVEAVAIVGDRDLLFQAFANLVDNAIKYTPEAGRIDIEMTATGREVRVSVADSGSGIPAEAREKVFRRFFRLETSRTAPGSGLGLSLVAAVAKHHHAVVRLDDNRPGLAVTVVFPRAFDKRTSGR